MVKEYIEINPRTPEGVLESYQKVAVDMQSASYSLCILGNMIQQSEIKDDALEFPANWIGHLLIMMGNNLYDTSFEVLNMAEKLREQGADHE